MQNTLYMGNLSSKRDWGHAKDYIKAMYLILQQDEPDDYVIATGVSTEIREFVRKAFAQVGAEITFSGEKTDEKGSVTSIDDHLFIKKVGEEHLANFKIRCKNNPVILKVDSTYFRPTEVDFLLGDATRAREKLGWIPEYSLDEMISEMVTSDLNLMKKEHYLKNGGYKTLNYFE
jgi:GDPmannose 4,6-dehydratase